MAQKRSGWPFFEDISPCSGGRFFFQKLALSAGGPKTAPGCIFVVFLRIRGIECMHFYGVSAHPSYRLQVFFCVLSDPSYRIHVFFCVLGVWPAQSISLKEALFGALGPGWPENGQDGFFLKIFPHVPAQGFFFQKLALSAGGEYMHFYVQCGNPAYRIYAFLCAT